MNSEDFYNKLYSSLCENTIETENNIQEPTHCLITNDPLEDKYVTLYCKHSFNYPALFNEIKQQKEVYVKTEVQRLRRDQIKCPYCRHVQQGVLPYWDNHPKVRYVNHPQTLQMKPNYCSYTFKSGKRKGEACNKRCYDNLCITCEKKVEKQVQRKQKKLNKTNVSSTNEILCNEQLKSGKRKGELCNCKVKKGFSKCGRHTPK